MSRVLHEHNSNITYLEHQTLRSIYCKHLLDEAASGCRSAFVVTHFLLQIVIIFPCLPFLLPFCVTRHSLGA